jgi:hypothetical protein
VNAGALAVGAAASAVLASSPKLQPRIRNDNPRTTTTIKMRPRAASVRGLGSLGGCGTVNI